MQRWFLCVVALQVAFLAACGPPPTAERLPSVPPSEANPVGASTATAQASLRPTLKTFERDLYLAPLPEGDPFGLFRTYATLVHEGQLLTYDLLDPFAPVLVWESEQLGENARGLVVSETNAYLVVDGQLQIWDVSTGRKLSFLAADAQEAAISRGQLYLIRSRVLQVESLTIVDISEPTNPRELCQVDLGSIKPHRVRITGDHLYFLHREHTDLCSIGPDCHLVLEGRLPVPTNISSEVAESGGYAFLGTDSGLWALDIRNPSADGQVGYYPFPAHHLAVEGSTGYLISSFCEGEEPEDGQFSHGCGHIVEVLDLSHPEEPKMQGYARLHLAQTDLGYLEEARFPGRYVFLKSNMGSWYLLDLEWLKPSHRMLRLSHGRHRRDNGWNAMDK